MNETENDRFVSLSLEMCFKLKHKLFSIKCLFIICQVNNCTHRLWWRLNISWPIEIVFFLLFRNVVFRSSLSSSSSDKLPFVPRQSLLASWQSMQCPEAHHQLFYWLTFSCSSFFIFIFFFFIHMLKRMCVHHCLWK